MKNSLVSDFFGLTCLTMALTGSVWADGLKVHTVLNCATSDGKYKIEVHTVEIPNFPSNAYASIQDADGRTVGYYKVNRRGIQDDHRSANDLRDANTGGGDFSLMFPAQGGFPNIGLNAELENDEIVYGFTAYGIPNMGNVTCSTEDTSAVPNN